MIKLEHTVLPSPEQMKFIIEGTRNPFDSWAKSDSYETPSEEKISPDGIPNMDFVVGEADYKLMQNLSRGRGSDRKFLRQIPIGVRITAPLYWYKEFDTYKVGTVANSCSTMHKIHSGEFTIDQFSIEHLIEEEDRTMCSISSIHRTIADLNTARELYLKTKDKKYWWQMIQLLPSSYNQTRNVTLNYEVLRAMYWDRKNHKLDEWREFCKWIEKLPLSELITGGIEGE